MATVRNDDIGVYVSHDGVFGAFPVRVCVTDDEGITESLTITDVQALAVARYLLAVIPLSCGTEPNR